MALLRYLVIASMSALAIAAPSPSFPSLIDVKLEDLQSGLTENCFSSVALVEAYLQRIAEVNNDFHVVTEVNPNAYDTAQQLDQERTENKVRGFVTSFFFANLYGVLLKKEINSPLHGIPILLRNNLATFDKMNTTAVSHALLGATVSHDSTIARKLREAGAIILRKPNLSQWSFFRSFDLPSGWPSHGGQVYGAYHSNQDPNGSSSGSGVAADLGLAFAAIGSETFGYLLGPAHRNNIVGVKPTVGLTSRHLLIPVSEHLDTVGPMARTVRDAAYLLQAIAGADSNDNYTSEIPAITDYVAACKPEALRVSRIGVPWNLFEQAPSSQSPEIAAFRNSVQVLQEAGATIEDANFTLPGELNDIVIMLQVDFMTNLASYFGELKSNPSNINTLSQLRDFTRDTPIEAYPGYSITLWDNVLDKLGYNNTDSRFWAIYQNIISSGKTKGLGGALTEQDLMAVVMPTSIAPQFLAFDGAPGVTVPMGYYPSLAEVVKSPGELVDTGPSVPFGQSILGRRWSEEQLIGLAYGYEQRTRVRSQAKRIVRPEAETLVTADCQKRPARR